MVFIMKPCAAINVMKAFTLNLFFMEYFFKHSVSVFEKVLQTAKQKNVGIFHDGI